MICPKCANGFLVPSLPRLLELNYRSFSKQIGTQEFMECGNCTYEVFRPTSSVDVDAEMVKFRREVNMTLSIGEL